MGPTYAMVQFQTFAADDPLQATVGWQIHRPDQTAPSCEGTLQLCLQDLQHWQTQANQRLAVILLLPEAWVSMRQCQLPAGRAKQAERLAPFAVEDQLAQDIQQLHIAILHQHKQTLTLGVIDHRLLQGLLAVLAEQGCRPVWVGSLSMLLRPALLPDQLWVLAQTDQAITVMQAQHCFTTDAAYLGQWLESASAQPDQPTSIRLTLDAEHPQAELIGAQLATQYPDSALHPETFTPQILWDGCAHAQHSRSLLQGEFAVQAHRSTGANRPLVRWMALAAAVLAVAVLQRGLETWRATEQTEIYWQASEALAQQIYGPQKRIRRATLRRELEELLSQAPSNDSASASGFLPLLQAVVSSAQDTPVRAGELRYQHERNELSVALQASDFTQLDRMKQYLQQQGYRVELSASRTATGVQGYFKIIGAQEG